MTEPIKFYSTADEYGEFSNFAGYPIRIGKKMWPTTEHYFQAMKFNDKSEQEKVRKANSPMLAARKKFGDNHKVRLGKKRSKTNGVELGKVASGLWV